MLSVDVETTVSEMDLTHVGQHREDVGLRPLVQDVSDECWDGLRPRTLYGTCNALYSNEIVVSVPEETTAPYIGPWYEEYDYADCTSSHALTF